MIEGCKFPRSKTAGRSAEIKGRQADGKDVSGFIKDNPLTRLVPAGNAVEREITKLRSRMKALNDRVRQARMAADR